MVTAREMLKYITDVAIADSDDIAAEFGITPREADIVAWNINLHWTMGKTREDPVTWQPRYGEELEDNLAAYNGDLDVPLSLAEGPANLTPAPYVPDEDGPAVTAPAMDVHVTELERQEAAEYLASGYNGRLQTTIERIAVSIIDTVRTLTVGDQKPRRVTCRDIHGCMEKNGSAFTYNTVRKVANALGAVGRLDRAGGGKGGEWRYGVKQ